MSLMAKLPPALPRELPKNEMTQAVCAFVVDCGQHEETNQAGEVKLKPKVMFIFELEQKRSDGLPFLMAQTFTNSLHKKSNMRPFLERWEGRTYTDADLEAGVPLEPFRGKNCYITPIIATAKSGKVYANIGSITKIRERDVPMVPTLKEPPKWVLEYIAKAKVKPEGYTPASGASAAFDDSVDLPF